MFGSKYKRKYEQLVSDIKAEIWLNDGIEYKSVDDDGLYRVSGRVLSIMKLSYHMTKLHDEYFKKIEA